MKVKDQDQEISPQRTQSSQRFENQDQKHLSTDFTDDTDLKKTRSKAINHGGHGGHEGKDQNVAQRKEQQFTKKTSVIARRNDAATSLRCRNPEIRQDQKLFTMKQRCLKSSLFPITFDNSI